MERVLPVRPECRAAGEVFPLAAWSEVVDIPKSCLGGREVACSMPELRMVQAVSGTHCFGNLHWRCRVKGIADILRSWSMGQCTAGTLLSGNLRLWSMVLGTADMQSLGTIHTG